MDRINHPSAVNRRFIDRNVNTGEKGTRVLAAWLNDVQEELATTIEAAGLTPTAGTLQFLTAIKKLLKIELMPDVGHVMFSYSSAFNPATKWPGTAWSRALGGRVPVGFLDGDALFGTVGNTGGERVHTLSVNELPSHTHDGQTFGQRAKADGNVGGQGGLWSDGPNTAATSATGGGQPFNVLNPYEVLYAWRRTG